MLSQGNRQIGGYGCLPTPGIELVTIMVLAFFFPPVPGSPGFPGAAWPPGKRREYGHSAGIRRSVLSFYSAFSVLYREDCPISGRFMYLFSFSLERTVLFQKYVKAEDHQPPPGALYRPSPAGAPNHDLPAGVGGHACLVQNFQAGFFPEQIPPLPDNTRSSCAAHRRPSARHWRSRTW